MLKQTLIKCAQLLERDDLLEAIKQAESVDDIKDKLIQNDVTKLISYYNYITNLVFENYIELVRCDSFCTDQNGRIYFDSFLFKPIKILSAMSFFEKNKFRQTADYLELKNPNTIYKIEYRFVPDDVKDFKDEIYYKRLISDQVLAAGIVSYFLASKSKFSESEYWNTKFMYSIFKYKNRRERRLRPNFEI